MKALAGCERCGKDIEEQQTYEYLGRVYCEDCYMDILSPPKACDPWAVYTARSSLQGQDKFSALTTVQRRIADYVKGKGEASAEEIMETLNLTEQEFKREFAVLRHMEVLRGTKKEASVVYRLCHA
jgi:hypothetical protein